jgi:hypothetical protein
LFVYFVCHIEIFQTKRPSTISMPSFHQSNEKPFALYTWEGPLPSSFLAYTIGLLSGYTTLKLGETLGSKPSFTHNVLQDSFLSFPLYLKAPPLPTQDAFVN